MPTPPTPADRIAAHPETAVHLAVVDPSLRSTQALDHADAATVEQVVEYVARRSGEKLNQGPGGRQ